MRRVITAVIAIVISILAFPMSASAASSTYFTTTCANESGMATGTYNDIRGKIWMQGIDLILDSSVAKFVEYPNNPHSQDSNDIRKPNVNVPISVGAHTWTWVDYDGMGRPGTHDIHTIVVEYCDPPTTTSSTTTTTSSVPETTTTVLETTTTSSLPDTTTTVLETTTSESTTTSTVTPSSTTYIPETSTTVKSTTTSNDIPATSTTVVTTTSSVADTTVASTTTSETTTTASATTTSYIPPSTLASTGMDVSAYLALALVFVIIGWVIRKTRR